MAAGARNPIIDGSNSSFADLIGYRAPDGDTAAPHGTTIVVARYADGIVMAGDRRATLGNVIALSDIEKVFGADETSVIGIAGVAGIATELVRLFQVELEHFEKVEGIGLSFDGKANRLGAMLRQHFPQALRGLHVLPLFAGWDDCAGRGRIFTYDGTGGRYEEHRFAAIGSGAAFARGTLKTLHDVEADEMTAVASLLQALFDAADEDSATSGLDLTRGIVPLVYRASAEGVARWDDDGVRDLARRIVEARTARPDGPKGVAL